MREAEQKKKEERRQELEMVRIRQAADEIFRRNEEEKHQRRREDAVGLKNFHQEQVVGGWSTLTKLIYCRLLIKCKDLIST